jgi:asparagine synthase (glutamine-hydrolysing)
MQTPEHATPLVELGQEEDNVYHLTGKLGQVVLIGHCLATPEEFEAAARHALEDSSVGRLQTLPGDYSVVVKQGDRCTVEVSPSGQFPVYWLSTADRPRFSTDGRRLGSDPNPLFLAASIVGCPELTLGDSALQGVSRARSNQLVSIERGKVTSATLPNTALDPSKTLEEGAEDFRLALEEAVERRIKTGETVTSDCSGGFDSTILTLLAAGTVDAGIDSFVQYNLGMASGDLLFARQVVADNPRIRLHELPQGKALLPFSELDQATLMDEPDLWTVVGARMRARLAAISAYDSALHITGEGGDALLEPSRRYMIDLARTGNWEALKQASVRYGRINHRDPAELQAGAIHHAERTLSDDLTDLGQYLRAEPKEISSDRLAWIRPPNESLAFLRPSIRQLLADRAIQSARAIKIPADMSIADYTTFDELRESGKIQRHLRLAAQPFGIDVHAPYLDRRVIASSMQVAADRRAGGDSLKKLLKTTAFRDILPDVLKGRNTKATLESTMFRGLRIAKQAIRGLLEDDCRLANMGIIEPRVAMDKLDQLDKGKGSSSIIERIIAAEIWVRKLEGVS